MRPDSQPRRTDGAYIGISGWRYAPWRGDFYPEGLAQRNELAYAAERFPTIELNGSFYSLQRPESYARAQIRTGRVGREQSAKRVEFDGDASRLR